VTQPPIEQRIFGKTRRAVTCVGLGGEGVLRTHGREQEARAVLQTAADQGITYFDSARVYADSELYYGNLWAKYPEIRAAIFQASKSASRDLNSEGRYRYQTMLKIPGANHNNIFIYGLNNYMAAIQKLVNQK